MSMIRKLVELISLSEVIKMEIVRVKINGIRNVLKTEICFDKLTAFVGLNGYGKSNIIYAIDFGLDFIKNPPQIKNKMMASKQDIPLLKSTAGKNFEFQIELELESNGKMYRVIYGYEFSWEKLGSPSKIISEFLKIKSESETQRYNTFIERNNDSAKYKKSKTGRCGSKIKIDEHSLVINKLTAYDNLFYIDIINKVNNIQFFIERHLDASTAYDPDIIVVKGNEELELQRIMNIPRAIYFLKKNNPDKFKLLINSFIQLFPDISDVVVNEIKLNDSKKSKLKFPEDSKYMFTDSLYTMYVTNQLLVQPLSFEALSDGAKRIFLMLTYAVIAEMKGISMIAIEEPENSIHPSLLQCYIDVLSQLAENCKIVFTSHSPYIIQYLNPRSIYVGINSKNGGTDFRRIAASKVNTLLRDAMQYDRSVGDYIFNILSTADTEEALNVYVESAE